MFMTRRGDEKVNVRRTVAVATQSVQQFLGWAIRRAASRGMMLRTL